MRQGKLAGALCSLLLVWAVSGRAQAQTITSGVLEGLVRDQAGAAMSEVSVVVRADEGGAARSQATTREGTFRFSPLPPGTYTVLVERLGYRPKRIENVQIKGGRGVQLLVALQITPPPVDAPEVVRYSANSGLSRAGVSQWLTTLSTNSLPWYRRELNELAGLSSSANSDLEIEGLPARLSAFVIDGVHYTPAGHTELTGGIRGLALPLSGIESAELVAGDPDVEWTGFSSGALAAQTRRGTPNFSADAFGAWSGGPLSTSKYFSASDLSPNSLWGGVLIGGPIIRDTAHFALGLEARRIETPFARPWEVDNGTNAALISAAGSRLSNIDQFTRPFLVQSTVINGFARFDWQFSESNQLSVRASFGQVPAAAGQLDVARAAVPSLIAEGGDLLTTVALASRLSTKVSNELRVGFTQSTRKYSEAFATAGSALPSTRIVENGARFGSNPGLPGQFERSGFYGLEALELPIGIHRFRLGVDVDIGTSDQTHFYNQSGEYTFGGATQFGASQGLFVQSTGAVSGVNYRTLRYGGFLQDTWNAAPDLSIVTGVRFDIDQLPKDDIPRNGEWFDITRLDTTGIHKTIGTLSPRIGATWNVGGQGKWIVRAAAGTYASSVDPSVMTELLTPGRGVRRGIGSLSSWPTPGALAVDVGPAISIPGPEFRGPLTVRTGLGISRSLGSGAMLHISGAYRSTDFLPRRTDLNLLSIPAGQDQNARPVYGPLVQIGQLVAAGVQNRRFSTFDRVTAITADGSSRYWGITASLERELNNSLGYFVNYTYSRTTDDWLGARNGSPEAQLTPFLDDVGDNWRDARSDFDVPHRLAAGLELRPKLSFSPRIAALYTFTSGYPFTPGFRDGVDVNGDGSGLNDPAFVDPAIAGISDLTSSWKCLADQAGKLADRNACRQPGVHSLNLRLGIALGTPQGTSAEIFAEGINILESAVGEPDRALYLIDAGRALSINSSGVVTLPLIANPHFGEPILRSGAGKMLRIGIQVKH